MDGHKVLCPATGYIVYPAIKIKENNFSFFQMYIYIFLIYLAGLIGYEFASMFPSNPSTIGDLKKIKVIALVINNTENIASLFRE